MIDRCFSPKLVAMIYPVAEILLKVALNTKIQKFNFKCPSHMCLDLNSFGRTFSVNITHAVFHDRLVWVVKSNNLTRWATRAPEGHLKICIWLCNEENQILSERLFCAIFNNMLIFYMIIPISGRHVLVSCLPRVGGSLWVLRLRYDIPSSWNIAESGVEH
jgi:hypothetical protein